MLLDIKTTYILLLVYSIYCVNMFVWWMGK